MSTITKQQPRLRKPWLLFKKNVISSYIRNVNRNSLPYFMVDSEKSHDLQLHHVFEANHRCY